MLWNWARKTFGIPSSEPPFQVGIYEKVFEFVLRMKGNYFWPASESPRHHLYCLSSSYSEGFVIAYIQVDDSASES